MICARLSTGSRVSTGDGTMEFDEYDYLEKTVENAVPAKRKESANGFGDAKLEEKDRRRGSKQHADDDHHSKRAKLEGDCGGQLERNSSRHGESDRRRREREHREERNGKERDRESRRERDRDMEREREKDGEHERSTRSRSRSERHGEDEHYRLKERSRETEHREKEFREREHRDSRRREKKDEAAEAEADPERDQRTVFAYQICLKADERDVYEFFSRAGKVRDVRLIMDRNSRRSKGVGYIEFYDAMSVPMAIALSGQLLLGQPVMVKPSEAEKNLVQSTATAAGTGGVSTNSAAARKLYVGNLHFNMTDDQLRQVFEPFGTVELVQLPLDPETGHCKGFGFVQFTRLEDAKAAQSLNGQLEIAGRTIKVSAMSDQPGAVDTGTNAGDLDDDDGGGLSLNARSRALLMQKLDRSGVANSVTGGLVAPVNTPLLPVPVASVLGVPPLNPLLQPVIPALAGLPPPALAFASSATQPVENVGVPSECLLLKNMFDPNIETEPDFDLDIKEDVQEECSKFGAVKHMFVDKNTAGFVYIRFDNTTSALNAQHALHGRWFAGKMITATFMLPQNYDAKFPNK